MIELDTRFALVLSFIDGIGPVRYQNIIKQFNNYEALLAAQDMSILTECGLTEKQISRILKFGEWDKIEKILEKYKPEKVVLTHIGDELGATLAEQKKVEKRYEAFGLKFAYDGMKIIV